MKQHQYLALTGALAAALLTGCGGGSSSSTTLPPPEPPPVAESVILTGLVTDMPIADAIVTITVDGQEFTADDPTGVDGSFEVEISSENPDALVLCEAADPNGPARFSALLNNFAGVQEAAGEDGRTDDTNITNVTTAQFLLVQELAADGSVDDLEELQDLSSQVDADELLELSAAIKVVVDNVAGVALPEEFDDVQDLAQAIVDGTSTFIEDVEAANPGIIDDTIDAVLNDDSLTLDFVASEMPGVLISDDGSEIYVLFADNSGYTADQDAAGVQETSPITWSITAAGELFVELGLTDTDTYVLLNNAAGVLTVHATYDEGAEGIFTGTRNLVQLRFDADGFDATTVSGSYRGAEDDEDPTEYLVIQSDGTGYDIDVLTGVQDDFFTWAIGNAGELELTDDGLPDIDESEVSDEMETVYLLEGSTTNLLNLVVLEKDLNGDQVTDIEAFPAVYTAEILTGPEADMANTLLLEGEMYVVRDPLDTAVVTFGTEGALNVVYQELSDQEWSFGESNTEWLVDAMGVIFETEQGSTGVLEVSTVTVISGLGGDAMVIQHDDDGTQETLERVVPFTEAELVGTWDLLDGTQPTTEEVVFNADGSGQYLDDGILDDNFDWQIDADGVLVLFLPGSPPATDHYHKIVGSTATTLNTMFVYRENGVVVDDSDPGEAAPSAVFEVTFVKQQ